MIIVGVACKWMKYSDGEHTEREWRSRLHLPDQLTTGETLLMNMNAQGPGKEETTTRQQFIREYEMKIGNVDPNIYPKRWPSHTEATLAEPIDAFWPDRPVHRIRLDVFQTPSRHPPLFPIRILHRSEAQRLYQLKQRLFMSSLITYSAHLSQEYPAYA